MQSIISFTSELLGQQGHVLSAYLAVLTIFQFRARKKPLHMGRIARHAVWSAGIVTTVHSFSREVREPMGNHSLLAGVVHVLVTALIGALMYELGCLFEAEEVQAVAVKSEP